MTNHIHLVIEIKQIPLSKIMQALSSTYTRYINQAYRLVGHLFQGRYKAKIIHDEKYLLALVRYIHINPVTAKIVNKPEHYIWSSHSYYLGNKNLPWLTKTFVLDIINKTYGISYSEVIENNDCKEQDFCNFDENGELTIINNKLEQFQKPISLDLSKIAFKTMSRVICRYLEIAEEKPFSISLARNIVYARSLIAYFAHYLGNYDFNYIGAEFSLTAISVSRSLHLQLQSEQFQKDVAILSEILKQFDGK